MRKTLRKKTHMVRIADILADFIDRTDFVQDEGPCCGNGWHSAKLSRARYRAERAIKLLRKRETK